MLKEKKSATCNFLIQTNHQATFVRIEFSFEYDFEA